MAKEVSEKVKAEKATKKKPKFTLEAGQKVHVRYPNKLHRAYMGAQGHVVSTRRIGSGFRVDVKLFFPSEKQREFALSELQAL